MNKRRALLMMTLPIIAQNLVAFMGNAIDSVMLGQFSEVAFSASSLANQVFFILSMVVSGIAGGSNVLVSQYVGRHDDESIRKTLGFTYSMGILFGSIVFGICLVFNRQVMQVLTNDPDLIGMGQEYLKYVCYSYFFYAITNVSTVTLRSFHRVKIAAVGSICALMINAFLNYCLIFGNCGMPALGLMGAGIATSIARFVELILVLGYIVISKVFPVTSLGGLFHLDFSFFPVFFGKCAPVTTNEFMYSFGESCIAMIIGRLGQNVVSAIAVYNVVSQLSSVLMSGTNSAACVFIGNTLGKRDYDELYRLKRYFQKLSIAVGVIDGVLMLAFIPLVPTLYQLNSESLKLTGRILMLGAVIEVFKSFQCMNMMGILRGAGDVNFACLNDIVFLWGCALPLGLLSAFVFHWPVLIVFICIKSDQVLKCFTSQWRLMSDRWIHEV